MNEKQITVIGCGLIGGSLALALRRSRPDRTVVAIDLPDRLPSIIDADVADRVAPIDDLDRILPDSGIVFLATTVDTILELIPYIAQHISPGTIVSDVGSTKVQIVESAKVHMPEGTFFIGGHPIAGSEKSGAAAADPLLFKGKPYILCPDPTTPGEALLSLIDIIDDISAVPVTLDADEHDEMLAMTSHVPHLLAISLVRAAMENDQSHGLLDSIAGRGFLDLTRIAGSDFHMWSSILETNKKAVDRAFDRVVESINTVRSSMDSGNLETVWQEVSTARRAMDSESATRVRKPDLRLHIDYWDEQLMKALGKRLEAVKKLGKVKKDYAVPVYDSDRERRLMVERLKIASALGVPESLVEQVFEAIIRHCRGSQLDNSKGGKPSPVV